MDRAMVASYCPARFLKVLSFRYPLACSMDKSKQSPLFRFAEQDFKIRHGVNLPCGGPPVIASAGRGVLGCIDVLNIKHHPTANFHPPMQNLLAQRVMTPVLTLSLLNFPPSRRDFDHHVFGLVVRLLWVHH